MGQLLSMLTAPYPSATANKRGPSDTAATGPTLALSWSLFQPPWAKQLPYGPHHTVFRHSKRFSSKKKKNVLPYICCQWSKGMHFPRTLLMWVQTSTKKQVRTTNHTLQNISSKYYVIVYNKNTKELKEQGLLFDRRPSLKTFHRADKLQSSMRISRQVEEVSLNDRTSVVSNCVTGAEPGSSCPQNTRRVLWEALVSSYQHTEKEKKTLLHMQLHYFARGREK